MAQFKRFSGSESQNYNSDYVGAEGELTWDPSNGLRIHDGNESGGNQIGIRSYQNLQDLPTNLASIQTSSSTNNRQFLRYNSSTYEMEYANDFRIVPFADIDYPDGVVGDKVGDVAFDDSGIYYCGSEPNFIGDVTITTSSGYSNQAWVTLTSIPESGPVQVGQRLTDGVNTSTVEEIVEAWPGYTGSREIIRLAAATSTWHDGTPGTLSVISSGEGVSTGNWVKFPTFNQALNTTNSVAFSGLTIGAAGGSEGGQIDLARAPSNSTLAGNVSIDIYQNKLRIFENGGDARGVYIDLTQAANTVGTDLLAGGGSGSVGYIMKSANFTAEAGKTYWLNTGSSAKTVTLPASPTAGDWVRIYDGSMSWQTYNLTVNGNGNNVRTFDMPGGWNSPASTGTISQSLVSPAGPFAVALIWDGTNWYSAI